MSLKFSCYLISCIVPSHGHIQVMCGQYDCRVKITFNIRTSVNLNIDCCSVSSIFWFVKLYFNNLRPVNLNP
jgi:hypothetical protein